MPPAAASKTRLWLRASPRGTRSGFAVLPDGAGGVLTITVLPKPWASRTGATTEVVHEPGTTTHCVLYETEYAAVESSDGTLGELAMAVSSFDAVHADLLAVVAPRLPPLPARTRSGNPFGELIDLMLLADRSRVSASRLTFEGTSAPSLIRLLKQERLLRLVEGLLFRARPRYAERTEILEVPRGRLSEKSLLLSMEAGLPRVESTFDELTMDTAILCVMAAALRVVASDRVPAKIARLHPAMQSRAVQLLRHLSSVMVIERERAIVVAKRLWLGPLDRAWQPALESALPVLRQHAVVPDAGDATGDAIAVHIRTEKFWEQCLEVALETAFPSLAVSRDASSADGVSVPAPWGVPMDDDDPSASATEAFPDFMFRAGRRVVLADAKYKLHYGSAPSSQDGYQLFAYSHLATLNGQTSDVGVILYPARAGANPRQADLTRMRDKSYPLWLVTVPFPKRADVQNQASWSAFAAALASSIRDFSGDWVPRPSAEVG